MEDITGSDQLPSRPCSPLQLQSPGTCENNRSTRDGFRSKWLGQFDTGLDGELSLSREEAGQSASLDHDQSEHDPLINRDGAVNLHPKDYTSRKGCCSIYFAVKWFVSRVTGQASLPGTVHTTVDQRYHESRSLYQNYATQAQPVYIAAVPIEHCQDSRLLTHSAVDLMNQFKRSGELVQREQAITHFRQALLLSPPGDPNRFMYLNNLASALVARFMKQTTLSDLVEAIGCYEAALQLRPAGQLDRDRALMNLSITLWVRFAQQGDIRDLNSAICHHEEVLTLRQQGHPERPVSLTWLANFLLTRFEQLGTLLDLKAGLDYYRETLLHQPLRHTDKSTAMNGLANGLMTLYQREGNMADLNEGITKARESLILRPEGDPMRPTSLFNLAGALLHRFKQQGNLVDLEEAITCDRDALAALDPGSPYRWNGLNHLASSLSRNFELQGRLEDLEEVLLYRREALMLLSEGHIGMASSLSSLADTLFHRFKQQGRLPDLEEVISLYRRALALILPGHPFRPAVLGGLTVALSTRFEQTKHVEDLDEAINLNKEALLLQPGEHIDRSQYLNLMANSLFARFKVQHEVVDLAETIKHYQSALDGLDEKHPDRSGMLGNLGEALESRFLLEKDAEDIKKAIKLHQQAIGITPSTHPMISHLKYRLATAHIAANRHKVAGFEKSLGEVYRLFAEAIDHPTASSRMRFSISVRWAQLTHVSDWDKEACLHAYLKSLELADRYLLVTSSISSRHKLVISSVPRSLASDAATWAIVAGKVDIAVEILEQGRTMLWSQVGRYRTPLDALREINESLAADFENIGRQLESSVVSSTSGDGLGKSSDAESKQYRVMSDRWNLLVKDIRKLDGFHSFLKATPFKTLKHAASNGPVVIVNISQFRSDAIVVWHDRNPTLVPLPNVGPEHVDQLALKFSQGVLSIPDRTGRAKIITVLRLLWEDIVNPIVEHLTDNGVPTGSRIWWCPTSRLASLPLHAAGPHRGKRPNLPDLFISSYTPTISALLRTSVFQPAVPSGQPIPKLLLVAQPGAPGQQAIESVRTELSRITQTVPMVDPLLDKDGTHEAVLAGLRSHRWVHFACHGSQDLLEPFHSHFHLHDKPLTLLDIIQARLPEAEFAFLSACHSAAGDRNVPDETIHLAAGLQFSGFKAVIGTMYAMADIDGPTVAEHVYSYLYRLGVPFVDYKDAALGLNIATRFLKENGVPIERWINFIHIGA